MTTLRENSCSLRLRYVIFVLVPIFYSALPFFPPVVLEPDFLVLIPSVLDDCLLYLFLNFRVVNVSSRVSHMCAKRCSDELKAKVTNPNITVPEVEKLMTEFVKYSFLEKYFSFFSHPTAIYSLYIQVYKRWSTKT